MLSDDELAARCMAGDDGAFAALLERHSRRFYSYCLKMLGDADAARDVMQEVWERFLRLRTTGERVNNPAGLLMRIARNLSLNYLRDARRHLPIDELPDSQHPLTSMREPTYQEELVVMALERLPLAQREVIILHVYSGYDYTEIARMMDQPVDNVRMRAMRGRAHLARIMGAMMAVEDERIRSMENDSPAIPEAES
jgi:RNA polymerase sigma-70 factor (ECF subfamily)